MSKRLFRIGLVALVLVAILVWAFRPAAVAADFATVARGPLEVTVDEEGQTRVRDRYVVSAPVPGRMERIELEPGDPVIARKTVLAQFRPVDPQLLDVRTRAELEGRVKAAETTIGSARAERDRIATELAFARSELKRTQELVTGGALAKRDLEAAEREVKAQERAQQSAEYAVRTAQYQLEVARASLLQTRAGNVATIPLYSPVNGVILRRMQQSEAVVPLGQPLLEVGDLADMEIVSDLLSTAAVRVVAGQPVRIEQWGGERALNGRVRRVEPSGFTKVSALGVEEQRVNVLIDFEDPREQWKALGDGFRVEVRIVVWSKPDVLKIPSSSLFRDETQWAVYKAVNGAAVRTPVEIGQRSGLEAEVLSGLQQGEQIVVYPSDAIQNGVKVTSR